MTQALAIVVFHAVGLGAALVLLAWARPASFAQEGARTAVQAALKGASMQLTRVGPALAGALGVVGALGAWSVWGAPGNAFLSFVAPFAVAALLGSAAWASGRASLEQATAQVSREAQNAERLFRSVLGRTLLAHTLGALLGLLPFFVHDNTAMVPVMRLSAALLCAVGAVLCSNLDSTAPVVRAEARTLASLARATSVGFLRPVRASLFLGTTSLLVHSELGLLLSHPSIESQTCATYLLLASAAATLALFLGGLSIRRGAGETSRDALVRANLGALVLFAAGLWLARGAQDAPAMLTTLPLWSLGAAAVTVFAAGLQLFWPALPSRFAGMLRLTLLALGLMVLGWLEHQSTELQELPLTGRVLIAVGGALLPLAFLWRAAGDSQGASRQIGRLLVDPEEAELIGADKSLEPGQLTYVAPLLVFLIGLGRPWSIGVQGSFLFATSVLLGASGLALTLAAQLEGLRRVALTGEQAVRAWTEQAQTERPPLLALLEVGQKSALPALGPGLLFLLVAAGFALAARLLLGELGPTLTTGFWLGCAATAALVLSVVDGPTRSQSTPSHPSSSSSSGPSPTGDLAPRPFLTDGLGLLGISLVLVGVTAMNFAA